MSAEGSARAGGRDAALIALAAMAFATSSPLAKMAAALSPGAIAAGRTAVAAAAIAASRPGEIRAALAALPPGRRPGLVLAGFLLAAHFALFLAGLSSTSYAAAVALLSLEPLAVVLAAWLAFGVSPRPAEAAGVLIATLGAAIVATGAGHGEHRLTGDLEVVAAAALFGAYVAAARGLRDAMPPLPYAACVYAVASVILLPLAVGSMWGATAPPPASTLGAVVLLGLVPTLVGHTLVQAASRRVSPSLVALATPGETLGSLAIGAALLGAWPGAAEGAGAAVIVAGATVAILAQRRP